ncbi:MAG: DUF1178 family protein [Paenirhodobacter sp.]|uniref:DUF1178 family protein n=1 Tax=Paenirhodobacter sp. TaxID=1965326 RepID=UPI003D11D911
MIRYTLKCDQDHVFESWFASAEAYEKLRAAGMVSCTQCGSTRVEKALMAPAVRPARKAGAAPEAVDAEAPPSGAPHLSAPEGALEEAIAAMRRAVEENSDYVGEDFAREARAMHAGEAPERAIHGEANPQEARALIEEGVPVTPLPFPSRRKTN